MKEVKYIPLVDLVFYCTELYISSTMDNEELIRISEELYDNLVSDGFYVHFETITGILIQQGTLKTIPLEQWVQNKLEDYCGEGAEQDLINSILDGSSGMPLCYSYHFNREKTAIVLSDDRFSENSEEVLLYGYV